MSGLKCNGVESHLKECPIYSQFSREKRVVGQESRLRQEGAQLKEGEEGTSVYACKQKEFNAAGVICGHSRAIRNIVGGQDSDIKCLKSVKQTEVGKLGREAAVRRLMAKVAQGGGAGEFHWTSFVIDILSAVDRSWRTVAMSANIPWPVDLNEGTDVQAGTAFTAYVVDSQRSAKKHNDSGVNRYRLLGNVPFLVKTRKDLILSGSKIMKPVGEKPKKVEDLLTYTAQNFVSLKGFVNKLKVGMGKLAHSSSVMDGIIGNMLAILESYRQNENHSSSLGKLTKNYLKLSEECANTTEASLRRIEGIGEELEVVTKLLEQFIQKLFASKRRSFCVPLMCQAYLNFGLDKLGARCVALCNHESAVARILDDINQQVM